MLKKLMKLYEEHRNIQKSAKAAKQHSKQFISKIEDLFDIASANAMEIMKIEEDKQFLTREKGRRGCMAGVDTSLFAREKRSQDRKEKEESRKRKHTEMSQQSAGK